MLLLAAAALACGRRQLCVPHHCQIFFLSITQNHLSDLSELIIKISSYSVRDIQSEVTLLTDNLSGLGSEL
jgi:hypothetical protein